MAPLEWYREQPLTGLQGVGVLTGDVAGEGVDCGQPGISSGGTVAPANLKEFQKGEYALGVNVLIVEVNDRPPFALGKESQQQD